MSQSYCEVHLKSSRWEFSVFHLSSIFFANNLHFQVKTMEAMHIFVSHQNVHNIPTRKPEPILKSFRKPGPVARVTLSTIHRIKQHP